MSKSVTISGSNGTNTFTLTLTSAVDSLMVSGSTYNIQSLFPTSLSANISGGTGGQGTVTASLRFANYVNDYTFISLGPVSWAAGETKTATPSSTSASNRSTSGIFNSNNPNDREVTVYYNGDGAYGYLSGNTALYGSWTNYNTFTLGQKLILDAPPTFTLSAISYDTNFIYAGLTTASVTVSNSSAKYGGSISSVAFTIGSQSVTRSSDGTLSIALNQGGEFTPTVTVTDSRGQTTTKTLDPITVNTYTAPSVSFDVARTLNDGTPDDEGTYGLIEAELTFSDVVATAVAPSVVLTDDDGTQTTPTVTWYTDDTLTTQVTWANVSSGDTVYGLFSGLSTQHSYQVSVRPRDSEGTGIAVTQTIAPAFYTVDFYAGGHGIAFGKPASQDGFECAMTATFENTATFGSDIYIDLSDYQTTGSVDKELYDAIVALGWDSDVLVN